MAKRADIQAAIKAALIGATDANLNVFVDVANPLDVIPSLAISPGVESLDEDGGFTVRRFDVDITARVKGSGMNAALDALDSQIFTALENNRLSGLAMDVRWVSNSAPELDGEGDSPFGMMITTYGVTYEID